MSGSVSETVALQARFELAVTPPLPAATLRTACVLGSERFDELAAQVGRRVHLGTSLMRETMDRLGATERDPRGGDFGEGTPQTDSRGHAPDLSKSTSVESVPERSAAVREDGSQSNFPEQTGIPCTKPAIGWAPDHASAVGASQRSQSSSLTLDTSRTRRGCNLAYSFCACSCRSLPPIIFRFCSKP